MVIYHTSTVSFSFPLSLSLSLSFVLPITSSLFYHHRTCLMYRIILAHLRRPSLTSHLHTLHYIIAGPITTSTTTTSVLVSAKCTIHHMLVLRIKIISLISPPPAIMSTTHDVPPTNRPCEACRASSRYHIPALYACKISGYRYLGISTSTLRGEGRRRIYRSSQSRSKEVMVVAAGSVHLIEGCVQLLDAIFSMSRILNRSWLLTLWISLKDNRSTVNHEELLLYV